MMRRLSIGCLALIALIAMGCSRVSDFTMISSKNVMLGLDPKECKGRFQGEDTRSIIFVIPTGTPDIKEAADRALERGGGNVLLNGVISYRSWYVPLIYGEYTMIVKGDVYQVSGLHKGANATPAK
ncbi:MAG: hypothetical protein NTX50_03890 [Candidatus Sumerlaeota bacterium]|nr:hypothetical protein [Candidatus Sumerlaeota bacterium]